MHFFTILENTMPFHPDAGLETPFPNPCYSVYRSIYLTPGTKITKSARSLEFLPRRLRLGLIDKFNNFILLFLALSISQSRLQIFPDASCRTVAGSRRPGISNPLPSPCHTLIFSPPGFLLLLVYPGPRVLGLMLLGAFLRQEIFEWVDEDCNVFDTNVWCRSIGRSVNRVCF